MACYSPITGYRSPAGTITFKRAEGWGDLPVTINCGNCIGCRLEHARQWSVRCTHEAQMHESNCFLTLTYSDEFMPSTGSLNVRDWQTFAKRLRKSRGTFRFYQCGEYGDPEGSERPHHHALIFGLDFSHDQVLHDTTKQGHRIYTSRSLDELWGNGACYIGSLTQQSAAYVARYSLKKQKGKKAKSHYERIDIETGEVVDLKPPFSTMSRRPGIGATWYAKYASDVYPNDSFHINGKLQRPPKYYDALHERENPTEHAQVLKTRKATGREHRHNKTPERLKVREYICKQRAGELHRS